jgi:tetratricopeptide (TPR) repeat protein
VTRRYKAFISYSWADKEWGGWLHRTLELYRTPRALVGRETAIGPVPPGLHPIFKDREEEAAGHGVGAAIEAALAASDFLIVICSPRSATSQWVNREVAWFKTHKDKKRILALIVDGEPGAAARGNIAAECFPKALTHKVGADLQLTEEVEDQPLAADARKEGDGKRGAKLKLAAALLGVGLDDLVKRDERRRTIRRRLAMSGMAAGMAIFAGVALYAVSQRDAAVVARNDAVKARDDAEGIIELILTDLKQDLEGYGTLKSVTQIGNRAIGYYEGQDVKSLTPDQLGRRARVLLMLGEADNKRGDLTAALARYQTAAATTSEQLARDPDNAQRIFDHAQSVFWVGYIAWQRGDHAKAKEQFTEYRRLATLLVEIDPANDDWQAELEYSYSNLGTLAMDAGDAAEAERWFREALAVSAALLKKRPDDINRVIAAGQSYAWLADSLYRQIKLQDAREARRQQIDLYIPISDNAAAKSATAAAEYRLAQIEISAGRVEIAAEHAARAAAHADALLAADPMAAAGTDRAALARSVLGEANAALGREAEARQALDQAIRLAQRLTAIDQSNVLWAGYTLAQPTMLKAKLMSAESASGARLLLDKLISDLRILTIRSDEPTVARVFGASLAMQARLNGNKPQDWLEIVGLLQPKKRALSPEAEVILAEALHRTERTSEAAPIVRRLYAAGYRHPDFMALLMRFSELKAAAEGKT